MTRWPPVLAQRAPSEGPRWTSAVGDQSSHPVGYGRDIGRPDRCHPQRLWESDVIDELKGQASEKEPALCVSLANQAILIVDTENSLLP